MSIDIFRTRTNAVTRLLSSIPGENCGREGLLNTPKRVAKMYDEIFSVYTKILNTY